jgi:hypothetical protein
VKLPYYDIVRRENGRILLWLEDAANLERAKRRVSTTLRQVLTKFSEFSFSTKKFRATTV